MKLNSLENIYGRNYYSLCALFSRINLKYKQRDLSRKVYCRDERTRLVRAVMICCKSGLQVTVAYS